MSIVLSCTVQKSPIWQWTQPGIPAWAQRFLNISQPDLTNSAQKVLVKYWGEWIKGAHQTKL